MASGVPLALTGPEPSGAFRAMSSDEQGVAISTSTTDPLWNRRALVGKLLELEDGRLFPIVDSGFGMVLAGVSPARAICPPAPVRSLFWIVEPVVSELPLPKPLAKRVGPSVKPCPVCKNPLTLLLQNYVCDSCDRNMLGKGPKPPAFHRNFWSRYAETPKAIPRGEGANDADTKFRLAHCVVAFPNEAIVSECHVVRNRTMGNVGQTVKLTEADWQQMVSLADWSPDQVVKDTGLGRCVYLVPASTKL